MFGNEVDYRLAKWLLLNMAKDGIITEDEMHIAWMNIAGHYRKLNRHILRQIGVNNSRISKIIVRFNRTLYILCRVPYSCPTSNLTACSGRSRHTYPFCTGNTKILFGYYSAHFIRRGNFLTVKAAKRFSHVHYAAAANGNDRFGHILRSLCVQFKKLFNGGV